MTTQAKAPDHDLILLNSRTLAQSAEVIRMGGGTPRAIRGVDVTVSAEQLETAARLLRDADPSICNGNVAERPGFIMRAHQTDPQVLVFTIGILPAEQHRINRAGELLP